MDVAARAGWATLDLLKAYLDGGATFIQIRGKQLPSGPLLELCEASVRMAIPYRGRIIVNDRADVARMANAAGVHVGQDDLPPAEARQLVGGEAVVGVSTHSVLHIDTALREPVSYIAVGPVFGTSTKETGYQAVGLDLVRAAVARSGDIPVVAIGGITLDRAESVLAAGATAVAIIGDLLSTGDPTARTAAYLQALAHYRV